MDELTNPYFKEEISGYLSIDHANQLEGVSNVFVNSDFKVMGESFCGVYSRKVGEVIVVFRGVKYKDYMDYTNETEEFTAYEPIGRN